MLGDMLRGGLAVTDDHAEADAIVRESLDSSCHLPRFETWPCSEPLLAKQQQQLSSQI